MVVGLDSEHCRADQRQAVPKCEKRDKTQDVRKIFEEKDHANQKKQVVVPGEHVLGADKNVRKQVAACQYLLVRLRNAMSKNQHRGAQKSHQKAKGRDVLAKTWHRLKYYD